MSFLCNLTSWFDFWKQGLGKAACQALLTRAQCLLGCSFTAPDQLSKAAPLMAAGTSCSPAMAGQSHSEEVGPCPSQEGKSRRQGQDQARGLNTGTKPLKAGKRDCGVWRLLRLWKLKCICQGMQNTCKKTWKQLKSQFWSSHQIQCKPVWVLWSVSLNLSHVFNKSGLIYIFWLK